MSLAAQLKQLQIPGRAAVEQLSSKPVSLLFDLKTSASLSNNAIFDIGQSGFDELLSIDSLFKNYEANLFSEKTLHLQRTMLTQVENTKLHGTISEFLILVSPYFLLKATQKCLEWLIRKFQVHIHEIDELVLCALPYHETQLFSRIVQLIGTLDGTKSWYWLSACQKDASGFSTTSLVNQCVKDRNSISHICKIATSAAEMIKMKPKSNLKISFSFYARTMVSILESLPALRDDFLSLLLPQIHAGLSSGLKDYVCASYMMIAMIASKVTLQKDVKKALLIASIKYMSTDCYSEGLLAIITFVLYQKILNITPRCLKALLSLDVTLVCEKLQEIQESIEIGTFIDCVSQSLVVAIVSGKNSESSTEFMRLLLDNSLLKEKQIGVITRDLLRSTAFSSSNDENLNTQDVIKLLASRHPSKFDESLAETFVELKQKKEKNAIKNLSNMVQQCLPHSKHQLLENSSIPLVLSLNHPDENIRITGIQQLFTGLKTKRNDFDENFVKSNIMARLNDDVSEVVNTTLKYSKVICQYFTANELLPIVQSLFTKDSFYALDTLLVTILNDLKNCEEEEELFVLGILGKLFHTLSGKRSEKLILALASVKSGNHNVFLNGMVKAAKELKKKSSQSESFEKSSNTLLSCVTKEINSQENIASIVTTTWQNLIKSEGFGHLCIPFLLIVAKLAETNKELLDMLHSIDYTTLIQNVSLPHKENKEFIKQLQSDDNVNTWLRIEYGEWLQSEDNERKHQLATYSFIAFLKQISNSLNKHKEDKDPSLISARKTLFGILSTSAADENQGGKEIFRNLLQQFLAQSFSSKKDLLHFLSVIYEETLNWNGMTETTLKAGVCALHITRKLLSTEEAAYLTSKESPILLLHICLLSSPVCIIRETVLDNLGMMKELIIKEKKNPWSSFITKIMESNQEILLDGSYIKRIFQNEMTVKAGRRKSEFASLMSSKTKTEKSEEKQQQLLQTMFHILNQLSSTTQNRFLQILQLLGSKQIAQFLIPIAKDAYKNGYTEVLVASLNMFDASTYNENNEAFHDIFLPCVLSQNDTVNQAALKRITSELYKPLNASNQLSILKTLLQIVDETTSVSLATEVRVILKKIDIQTSDLCHVIEDCCLEISKFVGSSTEPDVTKLEEFSSYKVLTEILEIMIHRVKHNKPDILATAVFKALGGLLKIEMSGFQYINQLLLSVMVNLTNQEDFSLPEDKFQIDILISHLQNDGDMTTSQECLRLLANAARLYPTCVLHHVMHIFSFMGKEMIRIDNEHSFNVMENTINAVVPILIKERGTSQDVDVKNQKSNDSTTTLPSRKRTAATAGGNEVALFILETFVDSIPHCPEHRRQHILTHLINVLGVEEYLSQAVVLLVKRVVENRTSNKVIPENADKETDEVMEELLSPVTLDFCLQFLSSYPAHIQIKTLEGLLHYLNSLSQQKVHKTPKKKIAKDSTATKKSVERQNTILHYSLMSYMMDILQSEKIVVAYQFIGTKKQSVLTQSYMSLLEALFDYASHVNNLLMSQTTPAENVSKLWKGLVYKTYDVIGLVFSLLPFEAFVGTIQGLLMKDNERMRKKSLEILCEKLEASQDFTREQELQLVTLLEVFVFSFKSTTEHQKNNETPVTIQLMLYVTKLLVIKLSNEHKEVFVNLLPTIVQLYTEVNVDELVVVNAILCVAELCKHLKEAVLQHLPAIVNPILTKIVDTVDATSKQGVLLLSSCLTSLQNILKSLPMFMSSFINGILQKISTCEQLCEVAHDATLASKVKELKEDVSQMIPARVLLPAIQKSFEEMMENRLPELVTIVDIYRLQFKHISKEDANKNFITTITQVFIQMFNVRSNVNDEKDLNLVSKIEDVVIQAFCDLVLKLSENTLRPLFLQLFNWSTEETGLTSRSITFYRLSAQLSKRLKSLFLLFAGHIVKNCTDVLLEISKLKKDSLLRPQKFYIELLAPVLDTLTGCFQYDTQGFVNKERFQSLMQPLVDQIEVCIFDDADVYTNFMKDHISPSLVTFASAVNDTGCWKPLNHQVLLKTKSCKVEVRLAALHIIGEIYNRMGESYMILVPETIPFLAESLEDDSVDVEQKCQEIIRQIEAITGESLQKYF